MSKFVTALFLLNARFGRHKRTVGRQPDRHQLVDKSANPTQVLFLGGQVTYRVKVMNTSPESVTLTSLVDDGFGQPEWAGQLIHSEEVGDEWWHMDVHLHEVAVGQPEHVEREQRDGDGSRRREQRDHGLG